MTSDGPIIESARFNSFQSKNSPSKVEHIVPLNVGFYVTLHGAFSASSRVAIVYSAFSFVDEFASTFPSHRGNMKLIIIIDVRNSIYLY